jgi:cytochrome c oxidase cbb3-type subunit IV
MYKDILLSIAGIERFPIVSLLLFVAVFTAVLITVARMDRQRASTLASLPLDEPERDSGGGEVSR